MTITGFLERVDPDVIAGWCFDDEDPARHVEVQLLIGRRIIGTTVAEKFRQDLAKAGMGAGDHHFIYDIPTRLSPRDLAGVEAVALYADGRVIELPRLGLPARARSVEPAQATQEGLVAKRLPHCILHIGTEKTGTTSLQRFMGANREQLLRQGFLVPRALAPHADIKIFNHIGLTTYALDIGNNREALRTQLGCDSAEKVEAHRASLLSALAREIASEGGQCHTLVLSNEHCQSRLLLSEEIRRLRNMLLSACDDIRVVLYVRPQHQVAVSAYGTVLKEGAFGRTVLPSLPLADDKFASNHVMLYYDYDSLVARWEVVFGRDKLDVRLFPKDIVSDFFAGLPLDTSQFTRIVRRQNVGLDAIAEQTLAALNRSVATRKEALSEQTRSRLINALEEARPGHGALPSRSEAQAFQERFEESNERLRRRRFPERERLFDNDFSIYPDKSMLDTPLRIEDMADVVVDVLRRLYPSV